jgi:hypothetical protein
VTDDAAHSATYVYGVVRADDAVAIGASGVGAGAPVRTVARGDLAALVSDVDEDYVRASREDLERHMAVLSEAAASATVVPLRFGTVMPGDDTVTTDLLEARSSEIEGLLAALEGRVELNLSGTYDERVFGEIVAEDPNVAALRERIQGRDEAATYYDRIRLGELVAGAIAAKREQDAAEVLAKLRPLADDVRLGEITHERSVFNAAFLVRRERLEEFDGAAEMVAAEQRERIRFRYTGPLPPYDFVGTGEGGPWG